MIDAKRLLQASKRRKIMVKRYSQKKLVFGFENIADYPTERQLFSLSIDGFENKVVFKTVQK